ncbi:chemotaxis-specific protein-glutamate methyltransferase CheB [Haloarculaceae archaeon H-GB2-1]|nr:chemotaxis-specific protein-glutamate methyltransferase CheB [Haloarculaceae archaeon H-GB1-1]MEA5408941.1 chemotaxis-specific protein-glutamate methyltransferase CheB [Haloarculaceae archaeon H-GB2-1]
MTRVVVVDDSPFMRTQIADILEGEGLDVVAQAKNGRDAVDAVAETEPDVVTMDIKMPGIGGLEAVRRIMADTPTPILMLSGYVEEGSNFLFESLDAGAVDFFPKPGGEVSPELVRYRDLLTDTVRAVADADVAPTTPTEPTTPSDSASTPTDVAVPEQPTLVIGASTGGPSVVEDLVADLPLDHQFRILVVLHMPPKFTGRYANRLDDASEYAFTEAESGTVVGAGEGVVARGDRHLEVTRESPSGLTLSLTDDPPRHSVRPAIDVTMETAAATVSGPLVGVILTGMGHDGAAGIEAIKAADGRTIAQYPESCAVDGMPATAIDTGCVDEVLPVNRIPSALVELLS